MRYRCDTAHTQPDGAMAWYAEWMGGPSLAKVENCRLINLQGEMRRTVTITGEPDTWFSQPAECSIAGVKVRGYVTGDNEGNFVFEHVYY